ncbi:MAG: hypothetical protein J7485_04165 [Sphingobium sp.]|nr:hypothetical protein [Sphingobium sp.]
MSHMPASFESDIAPHAAGLLPDGVMRALIADELDRIRQVLEDMGLQLCGDPEIVRSHMNVLQSIDEVCQRHENLARTLRAPDMVAEANSITLETLRLRLQDDILERLAERTIASDPAADEAWHDL